MPTVLRIDGFRFFFFSLESNEPPHVHVEHGDYVAKYWLTPVQFANDYGFKSHQLKKVSLLIKLNRKLFLEKWHEHFSN